MHGFRARLDYILKHNYAINRIFNWMASSFMKVWGYFIPLDDEMVIFSGHTRRVDVYTKVVLNYPHATSSATLGIGVKTEGNMVISGTKGYVYVPAPWWVTSFFEVRYEDQAKNKKFFYSYDGDGLRYEIQEFMSMIVNHRKSSYKLRRRDSVTVAEIIEKFNLRENYKEI